MAATGGGPGTLSPSGAKLRSPPRQFCCPIGHGIMHEPVMLETGISYEETLIQIHLHRGKTPVRRCPITRKELRYRKTFRNLNLRSLIRDWLILPDTEKAAEGALEPIHAPSVDEFEAKREEEIMLKDLEAPPQEFLCPFSWDIMRTPVALETGFSFEKDNIMDYLRLGNTICPVTRKPLEYLEVFPNVHLRSLIDEWLTARGVMTPEVYIKGAGAHALEETRPAALVEIKWPCLATPEQPYTTPTTEFSLHQQVPEMQDGVRYVKKLQGHQRTVASMTIARDGTLYTGSWDNSIQVWREGENTATLLGHTYAVWALAYDPRGGVLWSGGGNGKIRGYKGQDCVVEMPGHKCGVRALIIAPDGTLWSGGEDNLIRQWSWTTVIRRLHGHQGGILCMALASAVLWSGSSDATIRGWVDGECIAVLADHTKPVLALAVGEDGSLWSGSKDCTIRGWYQERGRCMVELKGHSSWICQLAVAADGTLWSCSVDKSVRAWRSGVCVAVVKGHVGWVTSFALHTNGDLYTGSSDWSIIKWKVPLAASE